MAVNPFAAFASMQDPYSMLQRSAGLTSSGVPLPIARQMAMFGGQQADVPYMSPQDEQSALALVGQMGAHAIGTVGALLDVPGGIVRNYLGGKDPLEPLQNPLTVTGRVTGRDLLKQWGIMGDTPAGLPWQPWKNPERMLRAAAGIGTEVLLDPTLFTSFLGGATTKAGKAMQSLGKPAMMELTDILKVGKRQAALRFGAIDELLKFSPNAAKYTDMLEAFAAKNATTLDALKSDRLGTAFGLHVPFTNIDVPLSTPLDLLAPTMDDTFGWLGRTTAGRMGKAAMNPEYLSTRSEYVQAQAPRIFNSILDMTADVRSKVEPIVTEVAQKHWFDPHHVARTLSMDELTSARHLVDDFGNDAINYVEFGKQIDFAKNGRHIPQAEQAEVYRLLDEYKRITAEDLPKDLSLGIDIDALDQNVIGYYSRQINKLPESSFTAAGRRVMKVQRGYQEARPEMTAYLPTKMINELSIDSRFSGKAHGLAATGKGFYSELGSEMQKEYGSRFASEIAAAEAKMGKPISWTGLARWVADMEPERAANRIPLYSTDVFTTMTRRVEAAAQSRSAAEGVHDILSANAKYYGDAITKGPKSESLMSVFSRTPGMKREEAMSAWISRHFSPDALANDPARREMFDKLVKDNKLKIVNGAIDNMDLDVLNKLGHAIKVPKEVGDDVNRIMAVFSAPEALGPLLDAWSAATNVWKKWVTIPWLQFHARNLISGLMRNWVGGHFNPIDYHHATAMIHSGSLGRGAARRYFTNTAGMTDEAATATLRNELFSQGVVSHHSGPQNLLEPIGGQTLDIPGVTRIMQPTRNISTPTGLARHVPSPVRTGLDTWSRSGAAAAYWVEAENRIAAYLNMRAKGMAPSAAAAKVRALQVGYDPIFATQTDKVIRQFIPFWGFNKNITPWTLKSLIENPGGPLAQVAKRTATMRSKDPVLPEAVENTAAIQLPTDEPGGMKFLSTLGMMEEGLYGFAAPLLQIPFGIAESLGVPVKAGSMPHVAGGEAMREILSQSNPFVKGLIEMATQRSLYHGAGEPGGRPLQSLNPPLGSLVARVAEALTGQPHTPKPIGGFMPVGLGHPLEQALPMVPGFARLLSTINTLTNPRTTWGERAMNVGTGLRIMDISPAQIAARRNEMLRNAMTTYGARTFTKPYFRPEDLASMLPHERRQADLLNQLSRWMSYKYRQEQKANSRN